METTFDAASPVSDHRPMVGRLVLASALGLLLLGDGPIYTYAGNAQDVATLSTIYGPFDGGPLARGPALYLLPAGWVLALSVLALVLSSFPASSRHFRHMRIGPLCMTTGLVMLAAVQLTPTTALMHSYLSVGGAFGSADVVTYAYEFYAAIVITIGVLAMIRSRHHDRR